MSIREAKIKAELAKAIRKEGGYARRIEDKFTVGMPDMVLIPLECPVIWAELKIVTGYVFHPTPRQFVELVRLSRPPHSVGLLIGFKDTLYVSLPKETVHLEDCFKQEPGESPGSLIRRAIANG
jgi:hypothetical protein